MVPGCGFSGVAFVSSGIVEFVGVVVYWLGFTKSCNTLDHHHHTHTQKKRGVGGCKILDNLLWKEMLLENR